jgi:hypothetical protein
MSFVRKAIANLFHKIGQFFYKDPIIPELKGCAKCEFAKLAFSLLQDAISTHAITIQNAKLDSNPVLQDVIAKINTIFSDANTNMNNYVNEECKDCPISSDPTNTAK